MTKSILAVVATAVVAFAAEAQTKDATTSGAAKAPAVTGLDPEYAGKRLSDWVRDLRDPDPGVRWAAMQAVEQFGPVGRRAGHNLVAELADRDPCLRANAAVALGTVGCDAEDGPHAIQALARALADTQQIVRYRAAVALAAFGPSARDAIPALTMALKDYNASWEVRKAVVAALATTAYDRDQGPNLRAVSALRESLRDQTALVRAEAVRALIVLGRPAPAELPRTEQALKTATRDKDRVVALWAHVGCMRMEKVTDEHLLPVVKALKSNDSPTRVQACRALETIGPEACDASVQDLIDALSDREPDVMVGAAFALARMGKKAAGAAPDLERLRSHRDPTVRAAAEHALACVADKSVTDKKSGQPSP